MVICMVVFAHSANLGNEQLERNQWWERLHQLDEDYKALVESYLRETGKVYVRPAVVPSKLQPHQPSAFKIKPPKWSKVSDTNIKDK